jgi:hypothetical protein
MNIVGIKLVSGEDLIAKITEFTKDKTKLHNPAAIGMVPDGQGRPTTGMADYLPFAAKKEIVVSDHHILYMYTPLQGMVNAYSERFLGIIPSVKPGLIMPETTAAPSSRIPLNENIIPFTKKDKQ